MRPFFYYFGGKYRAAVHYPPPQHGTVIEPFAGAAGYSTRYYRKDVLLIDADPVIAGLWNYLISVPASEIRRIPLLDHDQTVDDLVGWPQEARWLVGFWLNAGVNRPRRRPSAWMRSGKRPGSYWGERVRESIATQVEKIRHWRVIHGSYEDAPELEATWFIDPPYQKAGKSYVYGSLGIDYGKLGAWCKGRKGQVIVCENHGAEWLPFRPFRDIRGTSGRHRTGVSKEVVYLQS